MDATALGNHRTGTASRSTPSSASRPSSPRWPRPVGGRRGDRGAAGRDQRDRAQGPHRARTPGAAAPRPRRRDAAAGLSFEPEVTARVEYAEEKRRIAKAALAHLPRTGTILIDAGSTTARLAELIPPDRQLTAFTNTLPTALALAAKPNVTVYTLGGRVRNVTLAEVDSWAARTLGEINVDVAFLGANGISLDRGLTTPDPAEAAVKRPHARAAHAAASCWPTTARSTRSRPHKYGELADLDLLITDTGIPAADEEALNAAGLTTEKT